LAEGRAYHVLTMSTDASVNGIRRVERRHAGRGDEGWNRGPILRRLFIRHAQTDSNIDPRFDTECPGPGLNAYGLAQAQTLPANLVGSTLVVCHVID
jgi:hypothetical protein